MIFFTVPQGQTWQACSTDKAETRPALNNVLNNVLLDGAGYLVALDGLILAAVPVTVDWGDEEPRDILIPPAVLSAAPKGKFGSGIVLIEDGNARTAAGISFPLPPLNLKFPDWRDPLRDPLRDAGPRGLPPTPALAYIAPKLYLRLCRALGVSWLPLFHSGGMYIGVTGDGAIGVLMGRTAYRLEKEFARRSTEAWERLGFAELEAAEGELEAAEGEKT